MAEIAKAEVPMDQGSWEQTVIVECRGTPEEHEDVFYRNGNWGIEADQDGTFEVYAIVDEEPIMVKGELASFEEGVEFIMAETQRKCLGDSEAPCEEPPCEDCGPTEAIPADAPEASVPDEPVGVPDLPESGPEPDVEEKEEPKDEPKEEKKDDKKDEKPKEKSKPAKKSADAPGSSFRARMMEIEAAKNANRGIPNIPTVHDTRKVQKHNAPYGCIKIGTGKDEVDIDPEKKEEKEAAPKKVNISIRDLLKPKQH